MMNGSAGYEYAAYHSNSSNSNSATGTTTATLTQQQQQQQGPADTAGYLPAQELSPAGGPDSSLYDPTSLSQQNAAQHQLFMAYIAANYDAQHQQQHQVVQQQQQQQVVHHQHPTASSTNSAMAAFLGLPTLGTSQFAPSASLPVAQSRYEQHLGMTTQQQQQSIAQQQQQQHIHTPPRHLHAHSFEDLLFLQPTGASSLLAAAPMEALFPANVPLASPVASSSPPVAQAVLSHQQQIQPSNSLSQQSEAWLDDISLDVSSISLEPMLGAAVVSRLREKMNDVLTKYIPCVDFLVQCQQDLRKGLEFANHQRQRGYGSRSSRAMTPRQFYTAYVDPLPHTFYAKNQTLMESGALNEAFQGLQKLRQDAKTSERHGCESVKSTFLGGMKDGESWGLRKWLSKHGNALKVCTDLECILNALQKLDRSLGTTKKLSDILSPMARQVLNRLQADIPSSYQQHSTAHPYLPFFHRLESALRGMSNFDPEDDDVICIDSDDDDDVVVAVDEVRSSLQFKPPATSTRKRPASQTDTEEDSAILRNKRGRKDPPQQNNNGFDDASSSGESESESVVEIIDVKPAGDDWACPSCSMVNAASSACCLACGEESLFKELVTLPGLEDFFNSSKSGTPASFDSGFLQLDSGSELNGAAPLGRDPLWPVPVDQPQVYQATACMIADNLDKLATIFDQDQQTAIRPTRLPIGSFWDGERYGNALRLFAVLLRMPEASHFLEPVDEDRLVRAGNSPLFSHVIKHPLCFRDIANALLGEELQISTGIDGILSVRGLSSWNMWAGKELLQAIDLVFLNTLAYGNALHEGKSMHRSLTNKIRKAMWNGIADITRNVDAERRKQCMPTRRSEKSGYIVYKIDES